MAAPSLVGSTSGTSSSTAVLSLPSGWTVGDVAVAFLNDANSSSVSTISGFTNQYGSFRGTNPIGCFGIHTRTLQAGDSTFSSSSATAQNRWVLVVYRGVSSIAEVAGNATAPSTADGSGNVSIGTPAASASASSLAPAVAVIGAGMGTGNSNGGSAATLSTPGGWTRQAASLSADQSPGSAGSTWVNLIAAAGIYTVPLAAGGSLAASTVTAGDALATQAEPVGASVLILNGVNVAPTAPTVTAPNGGETYNNSATITWTASTDADGDPVVYDLDYSADNGGAWSAITTGLTGLSYAWDVSALPSSATYLVRVRARDPLGLTSAYDASNSVFTIQHNVAPNAPTNLSPAGNATIERTQTQRLSWSFSDPNAGDTQSKFDIQYRVGTGAWSTVTQTTTQQFYDAPGSTFAAGTNEWQVRTYDSQGLVGPYSASAFFVAATTPGVPTITTPTSGQVISSGTGTVVWSAPSQESYQIRKVADSAGAPDTATVLYDSGEVISTTARNAALTYLVNNRFEHVQVRVKTSGLFSAWASVRVQVSLTPPLVPTLIPVPISSQAAIQVSIANPLGNLLTANQASLETDTAGWANTANATLTRSTAQFLDGTASLSLASVAAGDMTAATSGSGTSAVPVTARQVYTFVASFRAATVGRSLYLLMQWFDSAGTIISSPVSGDFADNSAGWQQATFTQQAPVNAAYVRPRVGIRATAAAEVHYVDAIGLFPDPTGNLVTNPDFENGTAGWSVEAGATIAASTAQAYTGRQSLLVNTAKATANGKAATVAVAGLTVGQTYTASAYARAGSGSPSVVAYVSANVVTPVTSTGWTRVSNTFVATATTHTVYIGLDGTAVGDLYLDAVQVVVGASAVTYQPPTVSNLVTNPSFEVDTAGWTPSGLTLTSDTAEAYTSRASGKAVAVASGNLAYTNVATVVGQVYTLSLWIKGDGGAWTAIVRDSVGAVIAGSANVTTSATWQQITLTATATTTTTRFGVRAGAVSTAYLDAVQVEQGSVATPFVSGDLGAGYVWEASENLLSAAASSFEDGTAGGWATDANSTGTNSAAQSYSGTKSLLITPVGTTTTLVGNYGSRPSIVPGGTYTYSVFVRRVSAGSVQLNARCINATGTAVTSQSVSNISVAANTWTRLVVTLTADTAAAAADLVLTYTPTGATDLLYIDAVQVEQKPYATAYAAPGTANASTSRRQFGWAIPPAAVASNDIFRREQLAGGAGIRIATGVGGNGTYTDRTPASLVIYEYMARAVAANSVTADSAWTA